VELAHGEERRVEVTIEKDDLRFYKNGEWVLGAAYNLWAGNSGRDTRLPAVKVRL
jgi:hypothetical protein